jgi:hypothetical protein
MRLRDFLPGNQRRYHLILAFLPRNRALNGNACPNRWHFSVYGGWRGELIQGREHI